MRPTRLSDRDQAVLDCIIRRFHNKEAMEYLRGIGFQISSSTLTRVKKRLKDNTLRRIHLIASVGFEEQHIKRVDTTELIEKLQWDCYNEETDPSKRSKILKDILTTQAYLSAYYEASRDVIEKTNAYRKRAEQNSIPRDTGT